MMRNNPPKRGEQMTVDLERWQLGILEEAHGNAYATLTPRPVLRSIHGAKKSRKP